MVQMERMVGEIMAVRICYMVLRWFDVLMNSGLLAARMY